MRRLRQLSFRGLAKQRIIAEEGAECKKFLLMRVAHSEVLMESRTLIK